MFISLNICKCLNKLMFVVYVMPETFKISDKTKINMRVTRYLIDECVENLRRDGESFISDINSSLAWQCRKRILKHFSNENVVIKSYPAEIEFGGIEHKGYLFRLIKVSDKK